MVGLELSDSWHPKDGGPTIATAQTKIWANGTVKFPDESTASQHLYRDAPSRAPERSSERVVSGVLFSENRHARPRQPFEPERRWLLHVAAARHVKEKASFPPRSIRASAEHWASGGPWGNQIYAHDITATALGERVDQPQGGGQQEHERRLRDVES